MKNRKIFIGCVLGIMMFSYNISAQERNAPVAEEQSNKMTEKMVQTLELDEAQEQKVSIINGNMTAGIAKVKEQNSEDREKARAEVSAIWDDHDRQMKEVLSAEQYRKYQELKAERRQNMRKKRGKILGTPPQD
ncbi:MAG: hypothetical protein WD077_11885 [Bacteroidia bacterium]